MAKYKAHNMYYRKKVLTFYHKKIYKTSALGKSYMTS